MANERNSYDSGKANDSINAKDFIIGTLVGGIVGSLAALLLTPKSGKELRNDLNHQAVILKEKTGVIRDSALTKSSELAVQVKEKTNHLSQNVAKQSTEIVNKVKNIKLSQDEQNTDAVDSLFEQDQHSDIQQKLEETKKAFDETESKINQ